VALDKFRSSNDPPKYFLSVKTEIPDAPAFSYPFIISITDE
tara:strand:+ start:122 stop:244 length:123 start_codon:yes stop_codon:yes gene_type:complete